MNHDSGIIDTTLQISQIMNTRYIHRGASRLPKVHHISYWKMRQTLDGDIAPFPSAANYLRNIRDGKA